MTRSTCLLLLCLSIPLSACDRSGSTDETSRGVRDTRQAGAQLEAHPLVVKTRLYRETRKTGDDDKLNAFFTMDSRMWFEKKEGPGIVRSREGAGPWAAWDEFFNANNTYGDFSVEADTVCFISTEINDFYRLLDRPPNRVRICYFFDTDERIAGTLIAAVDPHAPIGRFPEFVDWAQNNREEELQFLMPEGEILPDVERARRWRDLLVEWRDIEGLSPVELESHP